jgi:sulfite reductase (NADPH) flavoprotein alpha-component
MSYTFTCRLWFLLPAQLLPLLRPLQPRLYSISSSPLEHSPANSGVQATIAVVRYSSLSKPRQGVTSTQVAERLAPGQLLPVFISKNPDFRLPQNPATPIIMVGPGTGLAPFRAFIQQRLLEQQQQQGEAAATAADGSSSSSSLGPMHLFFGCRRRDQDFLYGQQLQAWHDAGAITLHTAFSRETGKKVYVQQRLREAGETVWQLLQAGGHFYVCGDAGSMAGAVEAALLQIIEAGQPEGGPEGAAAYLQQLADAGRYQRDVWFS